MKVLLTSMKKEFHCNGNIEKSDEFGEVVKLSGDKRKEIFNFLIANEIATKDQIVLHGD